MYNKADAADIACGCGQVRSGESRNNMRIMRDAFAVLIPGGGKLLRRKYLSAAVILICWTGALDALILLRSLNPTGLPIYIGPALLAAVLGVSVANAANEITHIVRERKNIRTGRVEEFYMQALKAFVSGEDRLADGYLRDALQADELNADCLFLRAQVAIRLGRERRARRLLRKCGDFDENGKWKWEIAAALGRL